MPPKVLVPIADGTEEIEAVTIIDVLRRAGADVTVASVGRPQITASRGVKIVADQTVAECLDQNFDLIALPGGMPGAENLRDSHDLRTIIARHAQSDRLMGAICAAPAVVLEHHRLIGDRKATAHPGFIDRLPDHRASQDRVVVDGRLVTSRGPGTALEFALELTALLFGREKAEEVARPMLPPVAG
jgi:4-methyl-5(b-hydroxyethyl)-thiazole monophosphate biosynthesis